MTKQKKFKKVVKWEKGTSPLWYLSSILFFMVAFGLNDSKLVLTVGVGTLFIIGYELLKKFELPERTVHWEEIK